MLDKENCQRRCYVEIIIAQEQITHQLQMKETTNTFVKSNACVSECVCECVWVFTKVEIKNIV